MSANDTESASERTYRTVDALPYQQKSVLKDLYIEQDLTQTDIAERFDIDQSTVHHHLSKHDLLNDATEKVDG